ncbi:hypothetical protein ACIQU6_00135 [Streptomyces sp. NPDC090442]|uniref:hypothetical protein n=1 Tax=Streptomyces sp. NPDC090442 TaxID=3365962 RepID=UPI003814D595
MSTVTQIRARQNGSEADTASLGGEIEWSLTTIPDPITVSPASGDVELADIILVGSRAIPSPIEVNQIDVDIDAGNEAWHLALDLNGIQPNNNLDWTHTVSGNRITFKPTSGHAVIDNEHGITIQIKKLRISRKVGTGAVIPVTKWRRPGETNWKTDDTAIAVGKFPQGFYLRNFKADPMYIDNGQCVTLTWERSPGSTQDLLYDNTVIPVTDYTEFDIKKGEITRNTMFYLRSRAQQGTDYAERTLSAYVTVNKPDLEVGHLAVHGAVSALSVPGGQGFTIGLESKRAVAPTDGFLVVRLMDGQGSALIKGKYGTSQAIFMRVEPEHMDVCRPIKKGMELEFSYWQNESKFSYADGEWHPLGSGELEWKES